MLNISMCVCQIYKLHKRLSLYCTDFWRLLILDMTSATNAGAACTRRPLLPTSLHPTPSLSVNVALSKSSSSSSAATTQPPLKPLSPVPRHAVLTPPAPDPAEHRTRPHRNPLNTNFARFRIKTDLGSFLSLSLSPLSSPIHRDCSCLS